MTHLSIAVIILSILSFVVGTIFGVVLSADTDLYPPKTNYDKFVQVNREEFLTEFSRKYCIDTITFNHHPNDCTDCPFASEDYNTEQCISNTEQWLREPYVD